MIKDIFKIVQVLQWLNLNFIKWREYFLCAKTNKKCSCHLINLRLSHWSHLDYFNDVFINFSRPASFNPSRSHGQVLRSDPALRFNKKYLNLCSEDEW